MRLARKKPDLMLAAGFQVAFLWNYAVSSTAATCNDDQVHTCRRAVSGGELDVLPAGGTCQDSRYVHFTHLCIIDPYDPNVDYCCCQHEERVMCCRYHQSWSTYRCSLAEDTVYPETKSGLPLEVLLPSILVPVAFLLCCAFCCIKCCCYRYDDESEMLCCSNCKCCKGEDKKKTKRSREKVPAKPCMSTNDEANTPLTGGQSVPSKAQCCSHCRHSCRDSASSHKLHSECYPPLERTYVEPSAPPAQDVNAVRQVRTSGSYREGFSAPGVGFVGSFGPNVHPPHQHAVVLAGEPNDAYARSHSSDASSASSGSQYSALVNRSHNLGATISQAIVTPNHANDNTIAMPTVCVRCHGNPEKFPAPPSYDESLQDRFAYTHVPVQEGSGKPDTIPDTNEPDP